jgi:serine/threonine protein kinase
MSGELIDGRYQLIHQVASGGMATIYEALDTRLDRKVAVKIMHPHLAEDEAFVARFIREAKAAAALSHPNIVAVQDQGWNQNGTPAVFIVMELVEGHTLREYLFERGSLSVPEVIRHLIPILSALSAAHKIGIVHRDIKPENILISANGKIKVADFGLARGELIGNSVTAESSVIMGSVSYLSPEQIQRGVADSRSDVYSVGILAYELLTGEKPFDGESPIQIAYRHVNDRVPPVSLVKPEIPEALDRLISLATSVNPDQRPRDAQAFLDELLAIQSHLDPTKPQMSLGLDIPTTPIREKSRTPKRVSLPQSESVTEVSGTVSDMTPAQASTPKSRNRNSGKRRPSARVRRNRRIAGLIVVLLVAGVWYVFAGSGAKILVPSMASMSLSQAQSKLSELGLVANIEKVFNEDIDAGIVILTRPGGGGRVDAGGTVDLVVSKGAEKYSVPLLKGITQEEAQVLLEKNSLIIGTIKEVFSSSVAQGLVISSSPAVGTDVKKGSLVNLKVSRGPDLLILNSYVGKSSDQALTELTDAGFKVSSKFAYSNSVAIGAVISQTPDDGGTHPKGSKITIVVSQGTENVFIPNVYSLTQEKATSLLEDLQLSVEVKKIGTRVGATVTDVFPAVGSEVKRGSTVTITVG